MSRCVCQVLHIRLDIIYGILQFSNEEFSVFKGEFDFLITRNLLVCDFFITNAKACDIDT